MNTTVLRKGLYLVSFLILLMLSKSSRADDFDSISDSYRFKQLYNSSLISNTVTNQIIQDSNGFIWIGTNDGLNKFDGYSNTIYRPSQKNIHAISHFFISELYIDKAGVLWVGTEQGLNTYSYTSNDFNKQYSIIKNSKKLQKSAITTIFEDSELNLWIGTRKDGIFRISADRSKLEHVFSGKLNGSKIYIKDIVELKPSKLLIATKKGAFSISTNESIQLKRIEKLEGQLDDLKINIVNKLTNSTLFLGTNKGLFKWDLEKNELNSFETTIIQKKDILQILKVNANKYFIGTRAFGLFSIDLRTNKVENFTTNASNKFSINDNQILALFKAKNDSILIGSNLGINILNPSSSTFSPKSSKSNTNTCLSGNTIYSIEKDDFENVWIGAFGNALHKVNFKRKECQIIKDVSVDGKTITLSNVIFTHQDKNKDMWFGTIDLGVVHYNRSAKSFSIYSASKDASTLNSNFIMSVDSDSENNKWVSTYGKGFAKIANTTNQITNYLLEAKNSSVTIVNDIFIDSEDNVWLATQNNGLIKFDPRSENFEQFVQSDSEETGIPPTLLSIDYGEKNRFWLGSRGYGLFDYDVQSNKYREYTVEDGLLSNIVLKVVTDSSNTHWVSTDYGVTLIRDNKIVRTFVEEDGIQSNATTGSGFFDVDSDQVVVSSLAGMNIINISEIKPDELAFRAKITSLTSKEKDIYPRIKTTISADGKFDKYEITLNYEESDIDVGFSAFEYEQPRNVKYQFRLEGYDDWSENNYSKPFARYTNLEAGSYTFEVRSSINNNWESSKSDKLFIVILPPWWQTNWAYASYIILSTLVLYGLVSYRTKALQVKAKTLEENVKQRTQELAREKDKVEHLLSRKNEEFANVSHEFRTPLTLILGPIAQLIKSNKKDKEVQKLNVVQRNGYRLLRMVDQLLNLETFRVKSITQKSPQPVGEIIRMLSEAFSDLAEGKKISFEIRNIDEVSFEFTPDAVEKIIVNLLSNAIKYSNEGDSISVQAIRQHEDYQITVSDTGIGIPEDKLDSVFERFSRVLDENSENVTGAGIGLALVKSLVDSHQGSIHLNSKKGEGTTVTIKLPIIGEVENIKNAQHANDEIIAMEMMSIQSVDTHVNQSAESTSETSDRPVALVIEDNADMREYIRQSITDQYSVLTANNGIEGIEIAQNEVPDIIISDVMMPRMDGYQATQELRTNEVTSHIPVILLTARGDRESRLKGWHEKADDYITKPFDVEELKIRLNNLLEIRNILKRRFSETVFTKKESDTKNKLQQSNNELGDNKARLQRLFVDKLNAVLEEIYQDSDLSIDDLAKQAAMSQRQLFRKLRSILDMTPSEYLRRFRLEKSKSLLAKGKSIHYVAIEVGFSSQSYYGQCFKAQYEISPSEYRNEFKK